MERRPQHISLVLGMGVLALMLRPVMAADVSKADLAKMEREVQAQNLEHKKLQAQATQISLELTRISKDMIASAKQIQNSEEKISRMESELETLRADLKKAEENFVVEDDNLIKTLSALQNLALKPTEALFVQPLTPVEIIRSAMLLREAVPYLQENATRIREDLEKIENQKNLVEKQVARIIRQKKILENEHEQMKALVQRKSKIRNAVEIKSVKAKKKVERLASQANDLRDLLNKLEKQRQEKLRRQEEERRRLAELKAAEARRAVFQRHAVQFAVFLGRDHDDVASVQGKGMAFDQGRIFRVGKNEGQSRALHVIEHLLLDAGGGRDFEVRQHEAGEGAEQGQNRYHADDGLHGYRTPKGLGRMSSS